MRHSLRSLACALVAVIWPLTISSAQPAPASSQQSSAPAQSSSQAQTSPQTQSQTHTPSSDKQDSVADAARKTKEKKPGATKGKVLTEDDLSGLKGGVSVVGTESSNLAGRTSATKQASDDTANGEAYWRGKAQPILQKMSDIDQQIVQLKEDIKKYGVGGIDVATGMKEGVAYVEDRNAQVQRLEKKKANLQKQLDDLEEEGRKAGAEPAWFR